MSLQAGAVNPLPSLSSSNFWSRFRISSEETKALAKQGFVSAERRGPNCTVYKLRFRRDGRQQVRYLGTSTELATAVEQELEKLQQTVRQNQQMFELYEAMRKQLAEVKVTLRPLLLSKGFSFHGFSVRKTRRTN